MAIIGIDLGTSNSAAAVLRGGNLLLSRAGGDQSEWKSFSQLCCDHCGWK